jgi:hypothetical protein
MEGLLPLAILFTASASFLAAKKRKEGFVTESVKKNFGNDHAEYLKTSASKYNKTMSLMDPSNNVLLPPKFTPTDVKNTESKLRDAIQGALALPTDPSFNVKKGNNLDILMNIGGEGSAQQSITDCEKIKTIDCSAFDKQGFALNCGMCFQGGKTASGSAQNGGLYVSSDDVANAQAMADKMGSSSVNYTPSVGKCDPSMFVTSKAQCITLQKKLACQANQNFDGAGCSQCYQDGSFKYLQDNLAADDPQLIVSGTGTLVITKAGSKDINSTITLSSEPQTIELPGLLEGDSLQLNITPATASIAGYLIGLTASGDFRIDIIRLIQSDTITGSRPRVAGVAKVGDDNYTVLRPGRGQSLMNLILINPFTFINASEQEAIDCGATPYIKTQASATFLESSPCYKKGQKPGAYSMECLQQTFVSAGCTTDGTAYPSDATKASALMSDPNTGKALRANEIAGIVYNASSTAYTGINPDGTKMSIKDWNKVSMYCTGRSITSPCDFDDKVNGPLSKDCMAYLYNNQGAVDDLPGNVGPTYSGQDGSTSLNDKKKRYCTLGGSVAPVDKDGKARQSAIDLINSQYKGVNAVKGFFNRIHMEANDNTKKDDERKQAINMCYGVDLNSTEQKTPDGMNLNSIPQTPSVLDSIPGRTKTPFRQPVIPKSIVITMSEAFNEGGNAFDWGGAPQRFGLWINKQDANGDDNLLLPHMKKEFDKNGKLKILVHKTGTFPEYVVDRVVELTDFIEGPYYWQLQSTHRSSYQYGMYYALGSKIEISIVDPSTPISPALG